MYAWFQKKIYTLVQYLKTPHLILKDSRIKLPQKGFTVSNPCKDVTPNQAEHATVGGTGQNKVKLGFFKETKRMELSIWSKQGEIFMKARKNLFQSRIPANTGNTLVQESRTHCPFQSEISYSIADPMKNYENSVSGILDT